MYKVNTLLLILFFAIQPACGQKTTTNKPTIEQNRFDKIVFHYKVRYVRGGKDVVVTIVANKEVYFYQRGVGCSTPNPTVVEEIMELSNSIDTNKLGKAARIDDAPISNLHFFKDNKLQVSINSDKHQFPAAWAAMLDKLLAIHDSLLLTDPCKSAISTNGLGYMQLLKLTNKTGSKTLPIEEVFMQLLGQLLNDGKVVTTTFEPKYHLVSQGDMKINNQYQAVKDISTDGRYYCFEAADGTSVTIDIGINFLTTTLQDYQNRWRDN
ncbi:MAG: hypothetical protein IPN94_21565 [Sphingobacteriales bacterium]|nr:hypothetical protein [Sphingobacteriales bacterium]